MRPLTDHLPKCMVSFRGKPIIHHIIETMRACGISDIAVVSGFAAEKIAIDDEVLFYRNDRYRCTNMVHSLFCAEETMDDDLVISYADIVYTGEVLRALLGSDAPISVVIELEWERLWRMRMENPLEDAETLKVDGTGHITELGKKARSCADIEGQYTGLFKISRHAIERVKGFYRSLDRGDTYDGQTFENMYMTSLLQRIIDDLMPLRAVPIRGGWLEIDSLADLEACEKADLLRVC